MNLWSHRFSKNMNQNCKGFCPVVWHSTGHKYLLTIYCSYFGRIDGFINSRWNLLTFNFYSQSRYNRGWFLILPAILEWIWDNFESCIKTQLISVCMVYQNSISSSLYRTGNIFSIVFVRPKLGIQTTKL